MSDIGISAPKGYGIEQSNKKNPWFEKMQDAAANISGCVNNYNTNQLPGLLNGSIGTTASQG